MDFNDNMMRDLVKNTLRSAIQKAVAKQDSITHEEINALAQLCLMGMMPIGDEDPKAMVRLLSDSLLEYLVSSEDTTEEANMLKKLFQFFKVEQRYRNGELEEDWQWEWNEGLSGQIRFKEKD